MLLSLVREWLRKHLHIELNASLDYFLQSARDGTILAQLLKSYSIIDEEDLQLVEETCDPRVAFDNFTHIRKWLSPFGIELSENEVYDITHCQGFAGVSLFYELYQKLENKGSDAVGVKTKQHIFQSKYSTDEVILEESLCDHLFKQWDVINWEKDHLAAIMLKYVRSREEYEKYLKEKATTGKVSVTCKAKIKEPISVLKLEKRNYSYEELIEQQKAALGMQEFEPNKDEAKKILKRIKNRSKQRAERKALRVQMQYQLLNNVWKKIQDKEEEDFDKIPCEELLKKSMHEKETAEKLFNMRKQKDAMIQNRKIQHNIDRRKRDEEFVRCLFEESLEDQLKFHEKQTAKIAEHNRLYKEKLKLKNLKHQKLGADVSNDVVDLALKTAEYKNLFGVEPDQYVRKDWATLFVKQQPILDTLQDAEPLVEAKADIWGEVEKIISFKTERDDVLDEQDLQDYIHHENVWIIEEFLEQFVEPMDLGMNCLGYIVHNLLLKKYPLPVPQKPVLPSGCDILVCTNNMPDLTKLDYLRRLLELRGVKVIQVEDIVEFCAKAYEEESKTEYDDPFPENEDLKTVAPIKTQQHGKKAKEKKKAVKKEKKSKAKDKDLKKNKVSKKDKVQAAVIQTQRVNFEHKQSQTPKCFPWEKVILSNKARLGKIVATTNTIEDHILGNMFVEYLVSLKDCKGWVLLNYPNTYEQAASLEQALSGKLAPTQYYDKINEESVASMVVRETEDDTSAVSTRESDNVTTEETALPEEPRNKSASISLSSPRKISTISTITRNTILSVTLVEDLRATPEERIHKLMPDLTQLAYSFNSDDADKSEIVDKQSEIATSNKCLCIEATQSGQRKSQDQQTSRRQSAITFEASEVTIECQNGDLEFDEYQDYREKIEDARPQSVKEEITQTDFDKPEEPVLTDDDKPLERQVVEDIYEEKRISKIVPNPKPLEKQVYNTLLTAYIKVMPKNKDGDDNPVSTFEEFEKKDGLEKFYCDQGCFYLLQYKEFNAEAVKCLAKMVVGDYSLPMKSSVEIFGDRYKEAMFEVGDHTIIKKGKKEKPKKKDKAKKKSKKQDKPKKDKKPKDKKSDKGKKDKKAKKAKTEEVEEEISHENKEVQVPIVEEVAEEEEIPEPKPGDPGWDYVDLPLSEGTELSLATFWDSAEETYIRNFKNVVFNNRMLLNNIALFLASARESMEQFIVRNDQKQHFLRQFQKTLNDFDLDLRNDPETKSELLCRIDDFRKKLLGICDSKMRESEEERRKLITKNWIFQQFCEMVVNTEMLFQIEVDRFVDTLRFLSDYYTSIVTKSNKQGYNFHKEILERLNSIEERSAKFNSLFIDIKNQNSKTTEFHEIIEKTRDMAVDFVEKMKPLVFKALQEMKTLVNPPAEDTKGRKRKKPAAPKFEVDEEVKENADRMFDEWECAINGEVARMILYLNTIKNEAFTRLDNVISWIRKGFEEIFNSISTRYKNEVASVEKACQLLAKSVEENIIIKSQLSFDGDCLAKTMVALFPDTLVVPEEDFKDGTFKIEQLSFMVKVLLDLAPNGYIMRKTFFLLLQDMLCQEAETPKLWRNLPTDALDALFEELFDHEDYFYWKDFIIRNLTIPYPTREQLMDVRKQFRCCDPNVIEQVDRKQFEKITFWFEFGSNYKSTLFNMYRNSENVFNYSLMLLDFCKDEDPIIGFVKALELCLGKFICCERTIGEEFVQDVLDKRMLFEEQLRVHEETTILAKKAVSLLIDRVFEEECLTLAEIVESKPTVRNLSVSSFHSSSVPSSSEKSEAKGKVMYTQIGFEVKNTADLAYFLPLELILLVVDSVIFWDCKAESFDEDTFKDKVVEVYEECRNEKFNNEVLAHEFLNCEKLRELFGITTKFSAKNPVKLLKRILYETE